MPNDPLYIGIDLGTSGCRASAIDDRGQPQGETSVALPAAKHNGRYCEQDPILWWQAVGDCLEQLLTQIPANKVAAIAINGTSATLLLTDADGKPLGPALMYNDSRASEQATRIAAIAPAGTAAQGPSSTLAKLLWLQDEGLTEQAQHALHQADWVAARLSDRYGVSDTNNALKLGFDTQDNKWPDWLDALSIPRRLLPEVVPPGTPLAPLSPDNARRFGLSMDTLVVAGTTDSTAAFLATGASRPGEAVTSLGSTLVLKVITERPVFDARYGIYSQPLVINGQQRWLVGGASNSGGAVLRQFFNDRQMRELTPRLRPERRLCLEYYPLPAPGERFPVNDSQLAPCMTPRPHDDTRFFQALLEGISRIEKRGYDLLAELGAPYPVTVRSTGGGAGNPAWTAIRRSLLGVPMLTAKHSDAAVGTALLARRGAHQNNRGTP
ncbi:MAG: FGGY-family carbohydrate kinase [Gammaproteobacteria bacterium]|nr:FGGY-family carbohydrate kinase [Gammaproteobacteria bacterium]